jgi:KAP family P-loop domain
MPSFDDTEPVLSANTRRYVGETAFTDDRLDRRPLAEKLTGYLSRLNDGAVLAIDAPWGEGKTWFGRNWAKHLEDSSYKTVYIDAFEQDYVEDPFMLIISEILDVVDDGSEIEENLKKGSIEVGKALLPVAGKALVNMGGRFLLGSTDLSGEFQEALEAGTANVAELAGEIIRENLESYSKDKVAMQEFKASLEAFAETQDNPIVVFIDELDRCKPNFAVNLVERIKHFFDVPNIVFVLLLNRDQLEKAVKGVYGSETDAGAYLGKFVNFFFALPKPIQVGFNYEQKLKSFINATMQKYKFTRDNNAHDGFLNHIEVWSKFFNMSLRDIEKAVSLYSFSGITGEGSWIIVYLIALKVKEPQLYKKLVDGDIEAHLKAKDMIEVFEAQDGRVQHLLGFFKEWHQAYMTGFSDLSEDFTSQIPFRYRHQNTSDKLFTDLASNIDLSID